MRYQFIEDALESGTISKEARDEIYENCNEILKIASNPEALSKLEGMLTHPAITGAVGAAIGAVGKSIFDRYEKKKQQADAETERHLIGNLTHFHDHPEFGKDPEKLRTRFAEIAAIAPDVASNRSIMEKVLSKSYNSGLTEEDGQYLANIQRGANMLRRPPDDTKVAAGPTNVSKLLRNLGIITSIPLTMGAGQGLVQAGLARSKAKKTEMALEDSFSKALEIERDSSRGDKVLSDNPEKARMAFKSLAHFSPHTAMDPQAARAFMSDIVKMDLGINTSNVKTLTEIERNIAGSKDMSPFLTGFGRGVMMSGMPQAVGKTLSTAVESSTEDIGKALL